MEFVVGWIPSQGHRECLRAGEAVSPVPKQEPPDDVNHL